MIPFASQRGNGQDLATHLSNEYDNEIVQLVEIRGAVAKDLHGAFKEWQLQAETLTKCRKYLYSLSINPDPAQPPLSREQFMDYIRRTEEAFGLGGQPRAIVFHTKYGREHCHVAWSRVDAAQERAVPIAFDKEKLMMITREFARDHGLILPPGYEKSEGKQQRTLYEEAQTQKTGLTQDDHKRAVTEAWRHSDDAKSFVQALAERGYILATGKRPYVVVDLYGNMNALPKLIDDKSVRTKDVRAFLEGEFPPDSLPQVAEAQRMAAEHLSLLEKQQQHDRRRDQMVTLAAELRQMQLVRRGDLEREQKELKSRQVQERTLQRTAHREARDAMRAEYLSVTRQTRSERERNKPTGLAGFLGRVSGVNLIRDKLQRHHDSKQMDVYQDRKITLKARQEEERGQLEFRLKVQGIDIERRLRALDSTERRESAALERDLLRDRRVQDRERDGGMPSLEAVLGTEADSRRPDLLNAFEKARGGEESKPPDLLSAFERASRPDGREQPDGDGGRREEKDIPPDPWKTRMRSKRRERDQDR